MSWILYGATGYTGKLMAAEAARRGLKPVLAGRSASAVRAIAERLGLEYFSFGLEDVAEIREVIRRAPLVLNCAGPFSATAEPMMAACIAEQVHYLDITGEIAVFEHAHGRADAARRADVVLAPGVGFDVVPSDCLAASLVDALPAATELQLAFEMGGGVSPGTAKTAIEGLSRGGLVRRDGRVVTVPPAWKTRSVPFAHGERTAVTIPWGDVFTAYISTGVPNIEVYVSMPPATITLLRRFRWLGRVLSAGSLQSLLKGLAERRLQGPSEQARATSRGQLWGQASSADGRTVSAVMTTPNAYDLTVIAGLGIVEFLLENQVEGGYYTPSLLMGAGYAAGLPGVQFNLIS